MSWSAPVLNLLIQDEDRVDALNKILQEIPSSMFQCTCTGSTVLHCCSLSDKPNSLILLLSKGCDVNVRNDFDETPLHWAAKSGSINTVKILIKCGADINAVDFDGNTPLHWACESGNLQIVDLLLKNRKVNINLENVDAFTPLEVAVLNGDYDTMNLFLENGCMNFKRRNLIELAEFSENTQLIKLIRSLW